MNRIFLISGMHRCGTSYLAHALSFLGLELPKSIQGGAPDNPKGHFESFNVTQVHDSLFKEQGLSGIHLSLLMRPGFRQSKPESQYRY